MRFDSTYFHDYPVVFLKQLQFFTRLLSLSLSLSLSSETGFQKAFTESMTSIKLLLGVAYLLYKVVQILVTRSVFFINKNTHMICSTYVIMFFWKPASGLYRS